MVIDRKLAINGIITLILLGYPMLLLAVRGGMNTMFFLLLLASLFHLFRARETSKTTLWDRQSIAFAVAMASPVVATLLSQAYHGEFAAPAYDAPSRFLLAVPIFLALRHVKLSTLTILQYGLPLGAIAALLVVLIVGDHQPYFPRATNTFVHPIHFGDLALILGFLSLLSINWAGRDSRYVISLKLLGLIAGLYVSLQSQTRGGWIAIPAMILAWFVLGNRPRKSLNVALVLGLVLVTGIASYFLVNIVHHRVDEIWSDFVEARHGNQDGSITIRLQLWKAAVHMFVDNPVFGVGPNGFAPMMSTLHESGVISEIAARDGRGEVHNFVLASMARLGSFGLLSAIAVFLVPLAIFARSAKSGAPAQKRAALMGACFVLGVFVFCLSVEFFNIKMVAAFYTLTLAVLLAAATNKTAAQ